jgi:hypothetical protein
MLLMRVLGVTLIKITKRILLPLQRLFRFHNSWEEQPCNLVQRAYNRAIILEEKLVRVDLGSREGVY